MSACVLPALVKDFQLLHTSKLTEKSITQKKQRKEGKERSLRATSKDFHLNPAKAIGTASCCNRESEEKSGTAR